MLQDKLIYDVGGFNSNCYPFKMNSSLLLGNSKGWFEPLFQQDRVHYFHISFFLEISFFLSCLLQLKLYFFKQGQLCVTFGLNALLRKYKTKRIQWEGNWNYSNAEALIQYTFEQNYQINSWEFGKLSSTIIIEKLISWLTWVNDLTWCSLRYYMYIHHCRQWIGWFK